MSDWPLVGRSAEVAAAVAALVSNRGIVLVGEAGVGKSRLARGVLATLAEDGWTTHWFAASTGSAAVPFAPFASLLDELASDPVERLIQARKALAGDGVPVAIAVDDAHLLDDVSTAFVRSLIDDTDVRLVLTVRSGTASAPRWTDALDRVEIRSLGFDAVEELVPAALGGTADPLLVRWVWTVTEGNPLFARELLVDALERGAVVERNGRFVHTAEATQPGSRVQEVIAARLGGLDDDERVAVELVALAEPAPLHLVEQLVAPGSIESLERRGLLLAARTERRIEVRLAHPLHGEVTRSMLGLTTATAHRRRLIAAMQATGARRADDHLQLALWRAEIGDVDDWESLHAAARTLTRASEAAYWADFTPQTRRFLGGVDSRELAIRLWRAALVASGSAEVAQHLSWLLIRVGRPDEARAVARTMEQLVKDDRDRILVCRMRADLEILFAGDPEGPLEELRRLDETSDDPELALTARAGRAAVLALVGRVDEAAGLALSVYHDERAPTSDRLTSLAVAISTLAMRGRSDEAHAMLDEAAPMIATAGTNGTAALMLARMLVLGVEGRVEELEQLTSFAITVSEQVGADDGIAVFSAVAAQGAVGAGQLLTALGRADDALRRMVDVDPLGTRVVALTARATGLAYLNSPEAVGALDDLLAEPRPGPFSATMLRAKAWCEQSMGRIAQARETLVGAAAREAARDAASSELAVHHDRLRLGVDGLLPRVEELAAIVDGPYAPLVLAHVRGTETGDASLVEEAARGHESMGAWLYAAECWAQAGGIHRRAGRRNEANERAGRARNAIARCEGPPATPLLVESEPLGSLTRREAEIVALAADGLTDREIADRLVLSVRTVESHLRNAYAKLGVDGRDALKQY